MQAMHMLEYRYFHTIHMYSGICMHSYVFLEYHIIFLTLSILSSSTTNAFLDHTLIFMSDKTVKKIFQ